VSHGLGTEASQHFELRAGVYDRAYSAESADGHALRARMTAVLSLLGDNRGDVLDAGMGPGRLCAELERRGWTVSGVDLAEEMVIAARKRLPSAAPRLLRGSIEQLPYDDGSFDAVVATGVLEYTNVPVALAELARVLRPSGRAVVSYPKPWSLYGTWKGRLFYPAVRVVKRLLQKPRHAQPRGAGSISTRSFAVLLKQAGLTVEQVVYTSSIPAVSPLELVFPKLTARLARRLEGRGGFSRACFATQVVVSAHRTEEGGAP
jgi:ubiquinone/menaquinone biosynthesis C-methylase UbiE